MGHQDPRLSSPAERERSAAKDKGTGGQYVAVCSVSNSLLTHNSFVTLSQPFRIKCERYIFLKNCFRSSLLLILFPHVYVYGCICIMTMQHNVVVWIISSYPLISKFSSPFTNPRGIIPNAPITTAFTVSFMFHSLFIFRSLAMS